MNDKSAIKVENNVPLPRRGKRPNKFTEVLFKIKPKQSFVWEAQHKQSIYSVARRAGIKISVSQLGNTSFRVWRKS